MDVTKHKNRRQRWARMKERLMESQAEIELRDNIIEKLKRENISLNQSVGKLVDGIHDITRAYFKLMNYNSNIVDRLIEKEEEKISKINEEISNLQGK